MIAMIAMIRVKGTLAKLIACRFTCLLVLCGAFPLRALASEPPSPPAYGVRMEQTWIPMKDGIRLAATLYMPDGAKPGEKFPALLEYLPYRKDDGTAQATIRSTPISQNEDT